MHSLCAFTLCIYYMHSKYAFSICINYMHVFIFSQASQPVYSAKDGTLGCIEIVLHVNVMYWHNVCLMWVYFTSEELFLKVLNVFFT